jgi:diadenylate cyclase
MRDLIAFLSSIRWQDIVDVLLNSYILFRLYVLFRGTNVIRVVAGIALLWIFQRIAVAVGLIVTSWAMQGIIAGAALIIVIVFRNEIRNVLQAKNLRALLWGFAQQSVRTPIDGIVEGVYELARSSTGALIVLPGKDALDDLVQGGVAWQGLVSKDMLLSVFYNGNPVHDGAVLIEGDRVVRVGCILPLSQRDDLPQSYGTRHRAAAGLSEQSDALVIVVSEERGEVVVARNGTIVPIDDNLSLVHCLHEHLGDGRDDLPAVSSRKRREMIMAAALCFLCMAGVWFSFARGMETLTSIEVPLEYLKSESQMQILSTSANTVRLYLSGSTTLLSSLRPDQVRAKLDLGSATNGENTFRIAGDNIVIPPGVRLNRIEPSEIKVVLDTPVTKVVPIQVDWIGRLPAGLRLERASLTPAQVTVSGPTKVLESIATIYSRNVQLDKLEKSGQITVKLVLEPSALKMANGASDEVLVRYTIAKRDEGGLSSGVQ